jgi:hypothetical protein
MTIARLLPLDIHGALEAALAPALMAAPFVFGFGVSAAVVSVVLGVLILAVALATHAGEQSLLPISTHAAFDVCFSVALALASVVFALDGDLAAGAVLAGAAVVLIVISSFTRYTPSHR